MVKEKTRKRLRVKRGKVKTFGAFAYVVTLSSTGIALSTSSRDWYFYSRANQETLFCVLTCLCDGLF